MYSIQTCEPLVIDSTFVPAGTLLSHEEVVLERGEALAAYLMTLKPYCIIPSVLVCCETNVIIDGHHRVYALRKLGFEQIPVTFINYRNRQIVTDLNECGIPKEAILKAGRTGTLLPPKSSFHHVADYKGELYPLILLSVLFRMKFPVTEVVPGMQTVG